MTDEEEFFPKTFVTGPVPVQRSGLSGIEMIRAERARQITLGGYSDAEVSGHELYLAALAYLDYVAARLGNPYTAPEMFGIPPWWPWREEDWKPDEDMIQNLVRVGALVAASLDALT